MSRSVHAAALSVTDGLRLMVSRCAEALRRMATLPGVWPGVMFLRLFLSGPAMIGAIWPSSRRLARRMAAYAPAVGEGLVVELGAGTGVVTQALLDRGVPPTRLLLVERSPELAQYLKRRFPLVRVFQGDAARLSDVLPAGVVIEAIISSLPLRSLSSDTVEAIRAQWRKLLPPGCPLVQFTYGLYGHEADLEEEFVELDSSIVWRNLPPAKVMVLAWTATEIVSTSGVAAGDNTAAGV